MSRSLKSGAKSSIKENKSGVRPNRNTENKKAGDKDRGKKGSSKDLGKKGQTLTQDVSFKDDEQRSGDVGNASAKKVASVSDNDGNDCEPSVQDTNKSADVTKVREETVTKENNSDSFVQIDTKKSGDVPNVPEETVTKGNNSDSSGESDTKKSGDVSNVLKAKVSNCNDGNDCEHSVQDTNKSADVTNVREETVMKENNSDSSVTEHKKKSEGVRNDSQKTIKDISNGYHSAEEDKKNERGVSGNSEDRNESGVVSNESEISGRNGSVGDNSFADEIKNIGTVGNDSKVRTESCIDNDFGEENIKNDMSVNVNNVYNEVREDQIQTNMVTICDQPNVVSAIEILTPGYSNESEISGKNITVRDTSYADDRNIETVGNEPKFDEVNVTEGEVVTPAKSNESEISGKNVSVGDTSFVDDRISIETVGNETKDYQVHVGSEGEVTTQEKSNDSEICGETVSVGDTSYADDRKSIETFGNESKVDKVNVLSGSEVVTPLNSEKEEVKSSDVNSSDDDDDVPLSKLKMLRSMSHEIVNNENTVSFTSDAESTGIKSNGEYDGSTIERIIERLNDNEEKDNKPMSMEEYRLAYASEFFEAAVNDEETILKKTINEVDCQIYSHSDTTITTVTSDCVVSSDSEPEIIIHRTKSNRKKKKRFIIKKRLIYSLQQSLVSH